MHCSGMMKNKLPHQTKSHIIGEKQCFGRSVQIPRLFEQQPLGPSAIFMQFQSMVKKTLFLLNSRAARRQCPFQWLFLLLGLISSQIA